MKQSIENSYTRNTEECLYPLENTLNSVGKAAFLNLYPLVKKNLETTADEIEKEYPQYKYMTKI